MIWPNAQDYVEALQYPQSCFRDYELKLSSIKQDKFGNPKPISGNFAVVFQANTPTHNWAVRCFLRPIPEQVQKYEAIARSLAASKLPFLVDFAYLQDGIKIKSTAYPVVKMKWVSGDPLDTYIKNNLSHRHSLSQLLDRWAEVTTSLHQSWITHGDLQHGNILVRNSGEIILVDYDGVLVSENLRYKASELGHRHYQHPARDNSFIVNQDNYLKIDNFSAWAIGTSIHLLSLDPSLWVTTQAGDDNLIFRDIDFKRVGMTNTWQILNSHLNKDIRTTAQLFAEVTQQSNFLNIPDFNLSLLKGGSTIATAKRHITGAPTKQGSWIADHIKPEVIKPMSFPQDFLQSELEKLRSEYKDLSPLDKLAYKFRFQNYLKQRVIEHFPRYKFSRKIIEARAEIKQYERSLVSLKAQNLIVEEQLGQWIQKTSEYETTKLSLEKSRKESTQQRKQFEAFNLDIEKTIKQQAKQEQENYVNLKLRTIEIKPGLIEGIGKKRIEYLQAIGIYNLADIVSTSENRFKQAVTNIYNSDPDRDWNAVKASLKFFTDHFIKTFSIFNAETRLREKFRQQLNILEKSMRISETRVRELEAKIAQQKQPTVSEKQNIELEINRFLAHIALSEQGIDEHKRNLEKWKNLTVDNLIIRLIELDSQKNSF